MNINVKFQYNGKDYEFTCPETTLDRNYNDEDYACFFESIPDTEQAYFEVNIHKRDGVLIPDGYVNVFEDTDAIDPTELIYASIIFED